MPRCRAALPRAPVAPVALRAALLIAVTTAPARADDEPDLARLRASCLHVDVGSGWLADCIRDARLDAADRRAALARARTALDGPAEDRTAAVAALRRAAFVDAPALRDGLTEALVAAGAIAQDAAAYLPTRGQLARQLAAVVRRQRSLKKITADQCALADAPAAGATVSIHCEAFLRCKEFDPVDGEIDLTVGARGWKVVRAREWSHPNAGEECGFPMDLR